MESIQQQISVLTHKIDQIYQILDAPQEKLWQKQTLRYRHQEVALDLDAQIVGGEETSIKHPLNRDDSQRIGSSNSRRLRQDGNNHNNGSADSQSASNYRHTPAEWIIAQQDILIDSSGVEISHHQIKEQDLAPQIQIQRLTAQLTAAYNRIAALEEQLLARRWK